MQDSELYFVILTGLVVIASVLNLICWIIVLIQFFRENVFYTLAGFLLPPFAFVWGWFKARQYNIVTIMILWSIALGGFFLPFLFHLALAFSVR